MLQSLPTIELYREPQSLDEVLEASTPAKALLEQVIANSERKARDSAFQIDVMPPVGLELIEGKFFRQRLPLDNRCYMNCYLHECEFYFEHPDVPCSFNVSECVIDGGQAADFIGWHLKMAGII